MRRTESHSFHDSVGQAHLGTESRAHVQRPWLKAEGRDAREGVSSPRSGLLVGAAQAGRAERGGPSRQEQPLDPSCGEWEQWGLDSWTQSPPEAGLGWPVGQRRRDAGIPAESWLCR